MSTRARRVTAGIFLGLVASLVIRPAIGQSPAPAAKPASPTSLTDTQQAELIKNARKAAEIVAGDDMEAKQEAFKEFMSMTKQLILNREVKAAEEEVRKLKSLSPRPDLQSTTVPTPAVPELGGSVLLNRSTAVA